jgi:uncharacterized membrane protein
MLEIINFLKIIIASGYILWLPGFVISYLFIRPAAIDGLTRLAISIALSISIVPILAFYLFRIGIPIGRSSILIEVTLIIISTIGLLYFKNIYQKT